jgi:hypothetical protein
MLYRAYIDDSSDRNRERVVVCGAIIGDEPRWTFLTKKWNARLAQDGLQYFKSSHCNSLNGQFHKFRSMPDGKQRADKVRDDLDAIIHESQVMTLGATLPIPFYKTMLADQAKFGPIPDVPYRLVFQQVLAECAYAMVEMGRDRIVTFGHDDGDDFDALRGVYQRFKQTNKHHAKRMADFVPLDDKLHPPVQAADVAAWVSFKYAEDWVINSTAENLKRLRGSMYKMIIWSEQMRTEFDPRTGAPVGAKYVI